MSLTNQYNTRAEAADAAIPAGIEWIETAGYTSIGDHGGGRYRRISGAPAHDLYFQSEDGAYWELMIAPGVLGVTIEQAGGGIAVANNAPALNRAVVYLREKKLRCIYFPESGYYAFTERPNKFGFGVRLIGQQSRTGLVRNYTESNSYTSTASLPTASFLCWDGSDYAVMESDPNLNKGGGVENLVVKAGESTSGGVAVAFCGADVNSRPGYSLCNDLTITGDGSGATAAEWEFGVVVDGAPIATSGSRGLRDVAFNNVYVFRCRSEHFRIKNGVHIIGNGIDINDGGLGVTPVFRINGDTSPDTYSEDIRLTNLGIYGQLAMLNCTDVIISGRCASYSNAPTATNSTFTGRIASAFTNNSPSSKFYLSGGVV